MKQILLLGNQNVGKSVVFSRLTGAKVLTSNYAGTTVEFTKGFMQLNGERVEVVDVPGTYSLDPTSPAEETAAAMLENGDVVINVIDSTNLERSLNLTLQLIRKKKPMIVALNLWDEAQHTGILIDAQKLEEILGIPCVPTVAVTGEGMKDLIRRLPEAGISSYENVEDGHWAEVAKIIPQVQTMVHRHHTILERLGDASVRTIPGIPIGIIVLLGMFASIRYIGENLIGYVFEPLFERLWAPLMMGLSGALGGGGFVHDILVGKLVDGGIDFGESFGLLTTGLFVPLGSVLPYVFAFFIVLSFLEDSGYLPRLAVLVDNLMHRLGMHGMSIIPMLLGFGCNVPGALATRILESRRQRFIAATIMAISVPCMALQAMIIGLAGEFGATALAIVFGTLFVVWLGLGVALNAVVKGESPEILVDIPPYRIPSLRGVSKKIWMRLVWFIKEAVPWVLFGVFIANILYSTGIIGSLGRLAEPVLQNVLGLPEDAVGALVLGFLRKDVAVGMLKPLALNMNQTITASVVLSMYFPCVATFGVLLKEFGAVDMAKAACIMVFSALFVGGFLHFALEFFF